MPKDEVAVSVVRGALGEWVTFEGPLFRRLAVALAAAIQRGDLPPGGYLPAERTLAAALAVSRGTVVAAYDALRSEGWLGRRQGSGTWIEAAPPASPVIDLEGRAAGIRARRLTGRSIGPKADVIDLGVSVLPDASGVPSSALPTDMTQVARLAADHGYQPLGLRALRRRIAEIHTSQGHPTEPGEIAITLGAQQAIALAARLLVRPGDHLIVENPTYPGAIDVFSRAGARLEPVDSDGAGARVDAIASAAARTGARLAYVMPSCHNPTGAMMPEGRRRALAELADRSDLCVIEDNALEHLLFGDLPDLPPVAAFANGGRVLTIGSLSKLLWGGLRVGWIRGPAPTIERLGRLKAAHDFGNCAVSQAVALRALDSYGELRAVLRATYGGRAERLMSALADQLPTWRFDRPSGGLSLWVELPDGTAEDFARTAAAHGVGVLPGGSASADESFADHVRLSFALPPERLDEAVRRLAAAWRARRPATTGTLG